MNDLFYYTGAIVWAAIGIFIVLVLFVLVRESCRAIYYGTDFLNWYNATALSIDPTYKMKVSYPRAWCSSVAMMWLFNPNTDTHTMKGGHVYRTPKQRRTDKLDMFPDIEEAYTMEDAVEDQMPYHGE